MSDFWSSYRKYHLGPESALARIVVGSGILFFISGLDSYTER